MHDQIAFTRSYNTLKFYNYKIHRGIGGGHNSNIGLAQANVTIYIYECTLHTLQQPNSNHNQNNDGSGCAELFRVRGSSVVPTVHPE